MRNNRFSLSAFNGSILATKLPFFALRPLKSSLEAIDAANARSVQALAGLNIARQRKAIIEEVRLEVTEAPGWLDEVANLLAHRKG